MLNKERNFLYDNIKAVLISFVAAAHYVRISGIFELNKFNSVFYAFAFSFIMQGFFFVSGYFSKKTEKCHNTAVENFLIPYILFTIVMYLTRLIVFGHAHLQFYSPTHGMWFFLNMFVYRYILKYIKDIRCITTVSIVMYLFAGLFPFLGRDFSLGRIVSFFMFFIMGYFATEDTFKKIRALNKKCVLSLALIAICAFSYLVIKVNPDVELFQFREYFGAYEISNLEGIIFRIVLLIFTVIFLIAIINLAPEKETFYTVIGQRTLPIFVFHIIIRYVIKRTAAFRHFPLPVSYILLIVSVILSLYLFSRPAALKIYNKLVDTACTPYRYIKGFFKRN